MGGDRPSLLSALKVDVDCQRRSSFRYSNRIGEGECSVGNGHAAVPIKEDFLGRPTLNSTGPKLLIRREADRDPGDI